MTYSYFLGFDVSKASLDYCSRQMGQGVEEGAIKNSTAGVKSLLRGLSERHSFG